LLSRFKWGLSADLQNPDLETRIAILKKKMYMEGIELPTDIVDYIAYSITNNIRELEGALISIVAQASLNKRPITLELAKQMIDKFVKNTVHEISIDYIQKVVCDYFELPLELLKSKTRKREVVQARQLAMYFSKNLTKSSLASTFPAKADRLWPPASRAVPHPRIFDARNERFDGLPRQHLPLAAGRRHPGRAPGAARPARPGGFGRTHRLPCRRTARPAQRGRGAQARPRHLGPARPHAGGGRFRKFRPDPGDGPGRVR
jgi:hypothetical protein